MASRTMGIILGGLGLGLSAMAQESRVETPVEATRIRSAAATPIDLAGVSGPGRGADCDGNGALDHADLLCFMRLVAAGDKRADCDGSGVLDARDLMCFHNAMIAGVSWPDAQPPLNRAAAGDWCLTHQRYMAELQAMGSHILDAACAELGPCDNPAARNASIPDANTPIKTYRLHFHVFCENNGSNCAATTNDVVVAVERLNADYAPHRIQFIYQTSFINSSKYRVMDSGDEWHMKRIYANSPATKLNVYVVDTGGVNWGTPPWSGNALDKQGGIIMDDYFFAETSPMPTVLTHEVGHCLGLWHTFHGVDEVAPCGDCYEHAGRSPEEGDVTGDWCADTQPGPKNIGQCSDPAQPDACSGNHWVNTPYLNYMSYSYTCPIEFTAQQAGRMHCWTEDRLSGWLEQPAGPAPPAAPGTPTLTKLSGGQVRVTWADNSANETGFEVQRQKKSGPNWNSTAIVANVGADITTVTDAPGSGTFRYSVRSYNGNGTSAWSGWTQIKN